MNLREKQISQLRQSYFDVLIIGGGINGAVCAASLSKQGVSVALVEKMILRHSLVKNLQI